MAYGLPGRAGGPMPPLTILCVDDEPNVLHTLSLVLRHHGHTVLTATNSAEALKLAEAGPVDVVLLDHSICDRERICLHDLLRNLQPAIKAILHTGSPVIAGCLAKVPALAKPVHPRELVRRIERILAGGSGDIGPLS
jgi:CheY-like chemotaxis protein